MPRVNSDLPVETLLKLFEHQGMATLNQALRLCQESVGKKSLNRQLNKLTLPSKDQFVPLLYTGRITRPWLLEGAGPPEVYYCLTKTGNAKLNKFVPKEEERKCPDPQALEKSRQHSLALVDIAIIIQEKNGQSIVNRSPEYKNEEDENKNKEKQLRPDIQYFYGGEAGKKFNQFIEFEHTRKQGNLDNIIFTRMKKWQDFLLTKGKDSFSKNILVLFYLDDNDTKTLRVWIKAYYMLIQESGGVPAINIYFQYFKDFFDSPNLSAKDHALLEACADPEGLEIQLKHAQDLQEMANKILKPLYINLADQSTQSYFDAKGELLVAIQRSSARQEFFIDQVCKLHEKSMVEYRVGYSASAIPWLSIELLRQWFEQPQLRDLHERLIIGLAEVKVGYTRGISAASDILDRVVWEYMLSFFNFAPGGPLDFRSTYGNEQENKHKTRGLIPVTTIKTIPWDGVCDEEEAHKIEDAINWMISILIQYPGELGLRKYQKSFYSILTESLTQGQKKTSKSRKTASTTNKTDVSPKHKNSDV